MSLGPIGAAKTQPSPQTATRSIVQQAPSKYNQAKKFTSHISYSDLFKVCGGKVSNLFNQAKNNFALKGYTASKMGNLFSRALTGLFRVGAGLFKHFRI